jgi:Enterobacter phage Enc34, ssDNA-binding protein
MSKYTTSWYNTKTSEYHTPRCRMVYPHLQEPRGIKGDENSKPKYSVLLLVPKGANIDVLHKLLADTMKEKKIVKQKHPPIVLTKEKDKLLDLADAFPYCITVSATPQFPPVIFSNDAVRLKPEDIKLGEIYGGRYCVATLNAYGYSVAGNKGVSFGLRRIQLLDHGEQIGGGPVLEPAGFEAASLEQFATADDLWEKKNDDDDDAAMALAS